jgi:hypothetical protein
MAGHALLLCLFVGACDATLGGHNASEPLAGLPEFTATEASLFDDTISVTVFGAELGEVAHADGNKLAERTRRADAVVPVTVSTVSADVAGQDARYEIVVTPWAAPLAGSAEQEPMVLYVSPHSPSFPFLGSAGSTLVGTRLILFFRRYAEEGKLSVHWRLEPDNNEVRKAIEEALLLAEPGT